MANGPDTASGPDAAKVGQALSRSQELAAKNHFIANIEISCTDGTTESYSYERNSNLRRIKLGDGITYASQSHKTWMMPSRGTDRVAYVDKITNAKLHRKALMAEEVWSKPQQDPIHGGIVWIRTEEQKTGEATYTTYKRSREQPSSDSFYPLYKFIRHKAGEQILLHKVRYNIHGGAGKLLQLTVGMDYFQPTPKSGTSSR